RRSFRAAAGWYFARAHAPRLGSFGQNARWVRFAKMPVGFVSPKCPLGSFRQNARRPLALMLRGIAARRERRGFPSRRALGCVSKHEGVSVLILRDARTRVGRHSPLRLQDRLRRRPSMSEDANPVA